MFTTAGGCPILEPTELTQALERVISNTASEPDKQAVQHVLQNGRLVAATGERAVAAGGNVSDTVITTGDGNVVLVIKGQEAESLRQGLDAPYPRRLHGLPPPPRDFTGRRAELAELEAQLVTGGATISGLRGMGGVSGSNSSKLPSV